MKFNATHEKTTVIQVENQLVQVSNLPEEVKNEVATMDRLLQDRLDRIYALETTELAAVVKTQQVNAMVAQLVNKAKADEQEALARNKQDAEVQTELDKVSNDKPAKRIKK